MSDGAPGNGMLTFVLASVAVIALAWVASRMLSNWQSVQSRGRRLRVLEGVAVGKDRSLMLVAVGKEVLVVGASQQGINLVHKVEDPVAAQELLAQAPAEAEAAAAVGPGLPALEESVKAHLDRMRSMLSRQGRQGNG